MGTTTYTRPFGVTGGTATAIITPKSGGNLNLNYDWSKGGSTFKPATQSSGTSWTNPTYTNNTGSGGGYNQWGSNINDLLSKQMAQNDSVRQQNQNMWNTAYNRLSSVDSNWRNNQNANTTRGMVSQMLANPEAINDRTQALIQSKAGNAIDAQQRAMQNQTLGALSAGGQTDAASMAAALERIGNAGMAAKAGQISDLEVQRANQRNQDYYNAIQAGQSNAQQDYSNDMGVASTLIQNLPQWRADDYSGLIASLGSMGGGYGGSSSYAGTSSPTSGGGFSWSNALSNLGSLNGGGVNYSDYYGDRLGQSGGARYSTSQSGQGGPQYNSAYSYANPQNNAAYMNAVRGTGSIPSVSDVGSISGMLAMRNNPYEVSSRSSNGITYNGQSYNPNGYEWL